MRRAQSDLLIEAALSNAHDLVADASLLLVHERSARAHALAVFAMEEIGKAWLIEQHVATGNEVANLYPSR